jgi:hypothetical protein
VTQVGAETAGNHAYILNYCDELRNGDLPEGGVQGTCLNHAAIQARWRNAGQKPVLLCRSGTQQSAPGNAPVLDGSISARVTRLWESPPIRRWPPVCRRRGAGMSVCRRAGGTGG